MKPFRILLFLLSVFLVLFAVALYYPERGIRLGKNFSLHFISSDDIFGNDSLQYADISDIINNEALISDSLISTMAAMESDSGTLALSDTLRANADSLKKSITRIEFPENDSTILYKVFKALRRTKDTGGIVRIMHYGDSQIEGDRMTSLIRNRLQKKFGGHGVGLVPVSHLYDFSFSVTQQTSDNWYRYVQYGNRDTSIKHSRYGPLSVFCMFSPAITDSSSADTATHKAWIDFSESSYAYQNTKSFSQCRVFYGHNSEPFLYEILLNNERYDADIAVPSKSVKELQWKFNSPQKNLRLVFSGRTSPEIYGIALDPLRGVVVDNIAMRGCPGVFFSTSDKDVLKAMFKKLDVKLFLLQFGGNVVPNIVDDYSYYEKWFYRQLTTIKEVCPGAAIIVIGLSDMSVKEKNRYVTYPNLEKVRDALKSAAFRAGAGFWDMYRAMGGYNSMPSWVFADPPLAVKDFVHFNPRGAVIISQMFYNAFIFEYNRYENLVQKKAE
ncbi:MAG: hypothetical protein JXB00_01595 [Bacteroidales bacterium]|nr:hypothetical protein [Bacteroidales bacterium]